MCCTRTQINDSFMNPARVRLEEYTLRTPVNLVFPRER
jgi:hypothetical protein